MLQRLAGRQQSHHLEFHRSLWLPLALASLNFPHSEEIARAFGLRRWEDVDPSWTWDLEFS